MSTFVISDIHGQLEQLKMLIKKMNLTLEDELYILGDIVDRGPDSVKALQYLMSLPNCHCIAGNHEVMLLENMKLLLNEIDEDFLDSLSIENIQLLADWINNGASSTISEFSKLTKNERKNILEYVGDFEAYVELEVRGQKYLLVHAGLGNFSKNKELYDYTIDELVWMRTDYEIPYYEDGVYSTATSTAPSNFDDTTHTFSNFVFYKNELYCLDFNYTTNKAILCKVLDLDTKKVKVLYEICTINSNKNYLNNCSCVIHNDELFIFPFVSNKSKEYYIYDFNTDVLETKNNLPPLQTTYTTNYNMNTYYKTYYNGCLAFSDGKNIHLYNNISKSQYLRDLINNYDY